MEKAVDVSDRNQFWLSLSWCMHHLVFGTFGERGSAMPLGMPDKNVPLVFRRL